MNFIDFFMIAKHPNRALELQKAFRQSIDQFKSDRGLETSADLEEALSNLRKAKLEALRQANNEAGEMLGLTVEDLLALGEAKSKRKRQSGNPSIDAMQVAARSFVDAEREALSGTKAVDKAWSDVLEECDPSSKDGRTDRKTVGRWLSELQEWGLTTIPKAKKGRPKTIKQNKGT
ncbi:MAG TPA: hypothetical protein VFN16_06680 [Saccharospirillum sp.]|nr:hypothetical protein [Saccharospirillum sp.]